MVKRIMAMVLCVVMVLGTMGISVFAEETPDLVITTVEQLQAFAADVNGGNSYEGKLVVLGNDIEMMDEDYIVADMTPIGNGTNSFKGTFDGQGYTISDLYITYFDGDDFAGSYVGLFGVINTPGVVKNVTVHNPYIIGKSYVGGIVGMGYTGTIENCHVTGEIDIEGYYMVGGINGHGYATITNCSVVGDEDWDYSVIKGIYYGSDLEGDNVGGIVGHCGENNAISGCTVKNVDIEGTRKVGGIVGIADQYTDVVGCAIENASVATNASVVYANSKKSSMSIGGLIGQYQAAKAGTTYDGSVADCNVANVELIVPEGVTCSAGSVVGGARGGAELVAPAESVVASNVVVNGVVGATNEYLETKPAVVTVATQEELQSALDNFVAGTTIQLVENVNYGVVYLRPSPANPATKEIDWTGNNYRYETLSVFEGLNLVGAAGAIIDAIEIEGGTFYNSEHSQSATYPVMLSLIELKDVVIEGVTFTGKGGYDPQGYGNALNFSGNNIKVNGLTVKDCTFNNAENNARLMYKTESTTFVHNYTYGGESLTFVPSLANITVTGCTFNGGYMGMELRETGNLTISGNTFNGVTSRDMLLTSNTGCTYSGEVKIINNTSNGAGDRFVRASGIGNATLIIKDNAVVNYQGGDADFIKADTVTGECVIENNTFDGSVIEVTEKNGTFTVVIADKIAKIGDVEYATLADAIAAAQDGETIVLVDNAIGDVTVEADDNIIIDLAGFDIVGAMVGITNNGTLAINDSVGTGNVYTTNVAAQARPAIYNTGNITINGGWFGDSNNDTTDRNGINRGNAIKNAGTAVINGGYFTNISNQYIGSDAYAYAINTLAGGTTTINNATVYGDVNGLIFSDGTTVVEDGSFTLGRPNEENNLWYLAYGNVEIKGGTWTRAFKVPSWQTTNLTVTGAVSVSGGKFSVEIPEVYIAEGLELVENEDGTFSVQEKKEEVVPFKDAPLFLAGLDDEIIDGVAYHPIYIATSIDSLKYQKVGFDYVFSIFDPETKEVTFSAPYTTETSEVYSSISDANTTYTVDSIGGNGAYLFMNKLMFNAEYYHNNNTKITITPYAYDMAGNKITGWSFDMTDEFYTSLQAGSVKQNMFKEVR